MKREFYVGYLPVPKGIRGRLLVLLPVLLVAGVLIAGLIPAQQNDPGTGSWDLSQADAYTGLLIAEPYPAVLTAADDGLQTILLVSQGKTGVRDRVASHAGQRVTVRGNVVERDGRAMLTLLDNESGIEAADGEPSVATPDAEPEGRFQLIGQIIDPKCYLGAMKPGEGKIHKACATLCIKGGIPPMFLTKTPGDERKLYLLTDSEGQAVFDSIEPYIADPISAEGTIEQHGDLAWFKIDATTIQRLQ
ncbi:hypothetical protein [Algisphaera agarilytica]|uniref:Uncharacterized protein n=1 Tax=Algisphaera agarilytica TaxID=1385975 RepID=A0A7X0LM55_9BACT|nr:hypothetical protein [Algisphaera agarilytica]MBB6431296.1 hypothetical protein [Algisphaera agarilytica]